MIAEYTLSLFLIAHTQLSDLSKYPCIGTFQTVSKLPCPVSVASTVYKDSINRRKPSSCRACCYRCCQWTRLGQ